MSFASDIADEVVHTIGLAARNGLTFLLPLTTEPLQLYIVTFRIAISIAVVMTLLVSLDRLAHVALYVYYKIKCRVRGEGPESKFIWKALPKFVV